MKDLALVPLVKLTHYRSFWVQVAVIVLLLFSGTAVLSSLSNLELSGSQISLRDFFSFPSVWQNTAWVVHFGHVFFCFLIILLVANDDEHRLLRQHVIEGWSREQAAASYLLVCVFFSLLSLCLLALLVLAFGLRTGGAWMTLGQAKILACFFLQCMIYAELALLLAVFARKAVPAMMAFLGWSYIAEPLLGWVLDRHVLRGISESLPLHVTGELLPDPYVAGLSSLAQSGVHTNIVLLSGLYAVVFALLIWARLRFADL